ncbi:hypothetical protein [Amycolatopsis minnesotensis]|uniref:Uncharacterized protein n=1 Tax=Amycolatopsis minnesotensis TaxID=337894 RepID=A0ABP5DST5_9PSEU
MDDQKLETLFSDAAGEPPPASFSIGDVRASSARATARRRTVLTSAVASVVLLIAGFAVAGYLFSARSQPENNTASAPATGKSAPQFSVQGQPLPTPARPPNANTQTSPTPNPEQGGEGSGETGPRAGSTLGCDQVDRDLATALAGEIPVTAGAQPSPGRACSTAARSAGFPVADGASAGTYSVALYPPGVSVPRPALPPGAALAEQRTAAGGTLVVLSTPQPGSAAPFPNDVQRVATALAKRF